jgi:hypothetical protein
MNAFSDYPFHAWGSLSAGRLPVLLRHKVVVCKTEKELVINFHVRRLIYMRVLCVRKVVSVPEAYREVVDGGRRRHHLRHHTIVSR